MGRHAIVIKAPLAPEGRIRRGLISHLKAAGIPLKGGVLIPAVQDADWGDDIPRASLKAARDRLKAVFPMFEHVLALGSEAWYVATGKGDVTKYRGQLYGNILPTLNPSATVRNPKMLPGFKADLQYFGRIVRGQPTKAPMPSDVRTIETQHDLDVFCGQCVHAEIAVFDVETNGFAEFVEDAALVSLAVTLQTTLLPDPVVWRVPLWHPESCWRDSWRPVAVKMAKALSRVPELGGHNVKFDAKWMRAMTGVTLVPTFDTLTALAYLDENQPLKLKQAAQLHLGADPWGVDTTRLLDMPIDEVLEYNGLDAWHTFGLMNVCKGLFARNTSQAVLFNKIGMPLIQELIEPEMRGIYVDSEKLKSATAACRLKLARLEDELMAFVPPQEEWPASLGKKPKVNFNPSKFSRWLVFDHLGLPVLERGKTKPNGDPGDPSMASSLLKMIKDEHPIIPLLVERTEWIKRDVAFFTPWTEQVALDPNSRLHTTFKPWGTVTGRLSSGKEGGEHTTGKADRSLGVNLQQIPRVKLTKSVFGAPPGWLFCEADYSQVELRIAAFIAREPNMLALYAQGTDIHMATAMKMTGKAAADVTKEERTNAKPTNFGYLYGMGWANFIELAWKNYGLKVSEEEAQLFRKAYFQAYPQLLVWHRKQRQLVRKFGRVVTPFGRVRHLPDIYSPDRTVQGEAERQAINSPVQATASDLALLSLVRVGRWLRKRGLRTKLIGTVHDALTFEIPVEEVPLVVPTIRRIMENPPTERIFGVTLDVPLIADIKLGTHWGTAEEMPAEITSSGERLTEWLELNHYQPLTTVG